MIRLSRKQTVSVVIAANNDWHAVAVPRLQASGTLVHVTYRLGTEDTPVGGNLEAKLIDGLYAPGISSADIALVPDNDVAYHESAIVLAASATVATKSNVVGTSSDASVYDRRGGASTVADDGRYVLLVVKGDGTLVGTVHITLRAKDTTPGR